MQNKLLFLLVSILALSVTGCSTRSSSVKSVERVDPSTIIDLTGRWNDADAQMVSAELVQDALSRPWLDRFMQMEGRAPVVVVGNVINRSDEHISGEVMTKALEYQLLNSGRVEFVASPVERAQIRQEREEQQEFARMNTRAALAQETGADYMLVGSIDSIADDAERYAAVFYQVNLELIDIETNNKTWVGQKKIKKYIERKKYKW